MVDVSAKADTAREATASGAVRMRSETLAQIRQGSIAKGDVLAVAQVAGVMAAKQTPQMIPMCHTLLLTGVDLTFALEEWTLARRRLPSQQRCARSAKRAPRWRRWQR